MKSPGGRSKWHMLLRPPGLSFTWACLILVAYLEQFEFTHFSQSRLSAGP